MTVEGMAYKQAYAPLGAVDACVLLSFKESEALPSQAPPPRDSLPPNSPPSALVPGVQSPSQWTLLAAGLNLPVVDIRQKLMAGLLKLRQRALPQRLPLKSTNCWHTLLPPVIAM
jgi:hypothetical protein